MTDSKATLDDLPTWQRKGKRRWREDDHLYGNDAQEAARLEMEHNLFLMAFGRNFFAPVTHPQRILDVACGIGLWGLEMLKQFQTTQVTALDIDLVLFKHFLTKPRSRPYRSMAAERLTFVQADATKPLPFEDAHFDFTHSRIPDTFLSEEQWPRFIREMARVTQPDGWVELVAAGQMQTEYPSAPIATLLEAEIRLCQAINIAPSGGPGLRRYLAEAGISTFSSRDHRKGKTAKERELLIKDMKHVLAGTRDLIVKCGIVPAEEFDRCLEQFEPEATRAGFFMVDSRIWFQPKDQR